MWIHPHGAVFGILRHDQRQRRGINWPRRQVVPEDLRPVQIDDAAVISQQANREAGNCSRVRNGKRMAEVIRDDVALRQFAEPPDHRGFIALTEAELSHAIGPAGIIKRSRDPRSRRLRIVIQILPVRPGRHERRHDGDDHRRRRRAEPGAIHRHSRERVIPGSCVEVGEDERSVRRHAENVFSLDKLHHRDDSICIRRFRHEHDHRRTEDRAGNR